MLIDRLNEVFSENSSDLRKLLPIVHFVNNVEHNNKESKMSNKIKLLRSRVFADKVENPTLDLFDLESATKNSESKKTKVKLIQDSEYFLQNHTDTEFENIKSYIIESGLNDFYSDLDKFSEILLSNVTYVKNKGMLDWGQIEMMGKINHLFINDVTDYLTDIEVERLKNQKARNYYENHILIGQKRSLNENIVSQLEYFKELVRSGKSQLYFGSAYGEEPYESVSFPESHNKVYVDLSRKTDVELINLAVVKLKMEDDFISFKLNKFIVMMLDYELITEDEYNLYIYGTKNKKKIELTKSGLSISLTSRLDSDNQIENIHIDDYGNLNGNIEFERFVDSIDDFYRFEINRHVEI